MASNGVTGSGARRGGRTSLTASVAGAARQAAGRASTRLQPACAARVCGPLKQWVGWSCPKTTHKGGASQQFPLIILLAAMCSLYMVNSGEFLPFVGLAEWSKAVDSRTVMPFTTGEFLQAKACIVRSTPFTRAWVQTPQPTCFARGTFDASRFPQTADASTFCAIVRGGAVSPCCTRFSKPRSMYERPPDRDG